MGEHLGTNVNDREIREGVAKLAQFVHDLSLNALPRHVLDHAVATVRDTVGAMLAGATLIEVRRLADQAPRLSGPGRASLMARPLTVGAHMAALVNGTGGVSLEVDEGNQFAINHPAIHIVPAALALAEDLGASGAELLAACVAGYEVAVRVGRATRLRDAVQPFGTHAITGTAAAAARLLRLRPEEIAESIELATGYTVASSQSAANAGASVRNLFTGLTNHNGLMAPLYVQAGFRGEPGALEAVFGRILGEAFDSQRLGSDLWHDYYITRNYFKLFASSRWTHAPIEATAALMARQPFTAAAVAEIVVWTYDPAIRDCWNEPPNSFAAKHSIPYNVAVRIIRGTNGLAAFAEEAVNDLEIRSLAKRVIVREDPALTAQLPEVRPARVEITLKSGERLTETVERARGGFDNPLTSQELTDKFRLLAEQALPRATVTAVESELTNLPTLPNLYRLGHWLRGGHPDAVSTP